MIPRLGAHARARVSAFTARVLCWCGAIRADSGTQVNGITLRRARSWCHEREEARPDA